MGKLRRQMERRGVISLQRKSRPELAARPIRRKVACSVKLQRCERIPELLKTIRNLKDLCRPVKLTLCRCDEDPKLETVMAAIKKKAEMNLKATLFGPRMFEVNCDIELLVRWLKETRAQGHPDTVTSKGKDKTDAAGKAKDNMEKKKNKKPTKQESTMATIKDRLHKCIGIGCSRQFPWIEREEYGRHLKIVHDIRVDGGTSTTDSE